MSKPIALGVILFALGIVVGRASVLATQSNTTPAPTPTAMPVVAPPPSMPMGEAPARGGTLTGKVAEVLQVSQYTYLRLESGEWAAVPSAPAMTVGQEVTVGLQNEMQNFTSSSLNRTFARIWFGTLDGAPVAAPSAPSAPVGASGALKLRVVDVYNERAMLGGRTVKVAGTVDRVNFVQNLYYVHLKDGTGEAGDKSDDLLCISTVEVKKGDAVTMEGTVALQKDVGMGPIPVALDQAKPL
jgi:hypothetical protein